MQVQFFKFYGWFIDVPAVFVFQNEFCISILWKGVCVHFRACQMRSSANDVPSHALQHLSSLKNLVCSCPNLDSSKNVDAGT